MFQVIPVLRVIPVVILFLVLGITVDLLAAKMIHIILTAQLPVVMWVMAVPLALTVTLVIQTLEWPPTQLPQPLPVTQVIQVTQDLPVVEVIQVTPVIQEAQALQEIQEAQALQVLQRQPITQDKMLHIESHTVML
jgi:hypothetical protein